MLVEQIQTRETHEQPSSCVPLTSIHPPINTLLRNSALHRSKAEISICYCCSSRICYMSFYAIICGFQVLIPVKMIFSKSLQEFDSDDDHLVTS